IGAQEGPNANDRSGIFGSRFPASQRSWGSHREKWPVCLVSRPLGRRRTTMRPSDRRHRLFGMALALALLIAPVLSSSGLLAPDPRLKGGGPDGGGILPCPGH